ncbi:hypothetical protein Hypma_004231 [Hypsizygus marmoreus]|uniref:Uncharacterized protein n=1 Tax=Hypsizygus marmoreus TaxID=39966 RepID=A0A369J0B2_HYPMA|nr:hypothetical protein Hypma_004231 [Hypsizygus marmoreus]
MFNTHIFLIFTPPPSITLNICLSSPSHCRRIGSGIHFTHMHHIVHSQPKETLNPPRSLHIRRLLGYYCWTWIESYRELPPSQPQQLRTITLARSPHVTHYIPMYDAKPPHPSSLLAAAKILLPMVINFPFAKPCLMHIWVRLVGPNKGTGSNLVTCLQVVVHQAGGMLRGELWRKKDEDHGTVTTTTACIPLLFLLHYVFYRRLEMIHLRDQPQDELSVTAPIPLQRWWMGGGPDQSSVYVVWFCYQVESTGRGRSSVKGR